MPRRCLRAAVLKFRIVLAVQVSRGWEFQDISEMSEKFKIVSITKFTFELYTVKKKNGENPPCWTWQLSQKHYGSGGPCLLCIWRLTISIAEYDEDEWGSVCSRLRWWHRQSEFKTLCTNWYVIMFIFVSFNLSAHVAEWMRIIDEYLKISEMLNSVWPMVTLQWLLSKTDWPLLI